MPEEPRPRDSCIPVKAFQHLAPFTACSLKFPILAPNLHKRSPDASRTKGRVSIQPVLPVDILGAYVLLPKLR